MIYNPMMGIYRFGRYGWLFALLMELSLCYYQMGIFDINLWEAQDLIGQGNGGFMLDPDQM